MSIRQIQSWGHTFKTSCLHHMARLVNGSFYVDVTDQVGFPGLPTFDKWDVRDGRSGGKYLIKFHKRLVWIF